MTCCAPFARAPLTRTCTPPSIRPARSAASCATAAAATTVIEQRRREALGLPFFASPYRLTPLTAQDRCTWAARAAWEYRTWCTGRCCPSPAAPPGPSRPGSRRGSSPCTSHPASPRRTRSEEHTSELQSRLHLVCRLLLEK